MLADVLKSLLLGKANRGNIARVARAWKRSATRVVQACQGKMVLTQERIDALPESIRVEFLRRLAGPVQMSFPEVV